jgi:N-acetylglucosaminyl-diphospho-decaprenol L-rhamnosyltransferase
MTTLPDPEITVVVVNYNGGDYLKGAIASLARQTFRDFETIVVDNASTDGSLDRIGDRPERFAILRQGKNLGFAAANNIGACAGRGKWLALLNPDAEAEPQWLAELMRAVSERPGHRMAASLQIMLHDGSRLDGVGDCYLAYGYAWRGGFGHQLDKAPPAGECFGPCGAAALYPRQLFLDAGGFDERYFCYHEDVDLAFRLRLMGERCQFVPAARVRHAGSAITGRTSRFAVFHGVRNGVWTWLKNMPGRWMIITWPVWLVGAIALIVRGAFRGVFAPTIGGFAAAFRHIGPMLAARREVKKRRTITPESLAAAFAWNPFAYLGRQIDVRAFRSPESSARDSRDPTRSSPPPT